MHARQQHPVRRTLAVLFVAALAATAIIPAGTADAKTGDDTPLLYMKIKLENTLVTS
jgi:hypothetical protein